MAFPDLLGIARGLMQYGSVKFVLVIAVLFLTAFLERILRKVLHNSFETSSRHIRVDHTQYAVLKHVSSAVIYILGIGLAIYLIPPLKTLSISLFASAGVLAVIIGFASQKAFANIISGIFIAVFKPFRVGDIIRFKEYIGTVEDITLKHTVVRDFENKRIIAPNSLISEEVIQNYDIEDEKMCKFVEFGVSYDSDIDKAMRIIQEEAVAHPEFLDIRTEEEKKAKKPAVEIRVVGFGDSSVNLRAWVWTKNPRAAFRLGWDLNKSVKERFDKVGVEIPFPYRTVVMKKGKRKQGKKRRGG